MERIKKYLESIGTPDDVITNLMDEGNDEYNVEEAANTWLSDHRSMIKTDSEFIKPIQSAAVAKERGSLESKLKRTLKDMGAEKEAIAALEGMDSYLDLMRDMQKSAGSKKSPELDKLEAALMEANQRIEDYDANVIPGIKAEYEGKLENHFISERFHQANESYNFITKNPSTAIKLGLDYINSNYLLARDEDGNLKVTNKEGGSIFNDNGSKTLGVNDILDNFYSSEGLLKQNTSDNSNSATTNNSTPTPTVIDNDSPAQFIGVEKAKQRLADKAAAEA